jgi:hypothetical protein
MQGKASRGILSRASFVIFPAAIFACKIRAVPRQIIVAKFKSTSSKDCSCPKGLLHAMFSL